MRSLLLHSYGVSMPTRPHRVVVMIFLAFMATVIAFFREPGLTNNGQLLIIAMLGAWAAIGSLWFP
jgi:hypothetical protein